MYWRFASATRSSSVRPVGSPRCRGKKASRGRSPGTRRTESAGWDESIGSGNRNFERSWIDRAAEVATLTPMRTVVTGGAGFLGTHLVDRLRAQGIEPYVPLLDDWDLTRERDVERLFTQTRPELLIHLAAEVGGIGANQANPGRYWYANLMMGAHILEQSRLSGLRKLVLIGTICAYPKFTPVPFKEEDLWNGYPEETNAPYGIAKKTLLVGAQAYREQYGLDAIFLLPVNLYGPRDNFNLETSHVIPALISKFCEAKEEGKDHVVV